MVFPYQITSGAAYPVIKISLVYKNTKLTVDALVDSGANISIFAADVAESLGIDVESGKEVFLTGVGGRILGYEHFLNVEIAEKRLRCPVIFSQEFLVSFNLIGRKGIFDKFTICFNEAKQVVEIEPLKL